MEDGMMENGMDEIFQHMADNDLSRRSLIDTWAKAHKMSPAPEKKMILNEAGIIYENDDDQCRMSNGRMCPFFRMTPIKRNGAPIFICTEPYHCRIRECPASTREMNLKVTSEDLMLSAQDFLDNIMHPRADSEG